VVRVNGHNRVKLDKGEKALDPKSDLAIAQNHEDPLNWRHPDDRAHFQDFTCVDDYEVESDCPEMHISDSEEEEETDNSDSEEEDADQDASEKDGSEEEIIPATNKAAKITTASRASTKATKDKINNDGGSSSKGRAGGSASHKKVINTICIRLIVAVSLLRYPHIGTVS
jgi:hypothetical protein